MPKHTWTMMAMVSVGLLGGCASDDLDDSGATRQEGSVDIYDQSTREGARGPVLGETTGDGRPRDMRTGGGTTGEDVPAGERLDDRQKVREADPSGSSGPIRSDAPAGTSE